MASQSFFFFFTLTSDDIRLSEVLFNPYGNMSCLFFSFLGLSSSTYLLKVFYFVLRNHIFLCVFLLGDQPC